MAIDQHNQSYYRRPAGLAAPCPITLRRGQTKSYLEAYPDRGKPTLLLRVRYGDHTVVLDPIDPIEEIVARLSPSGLETVTIRHLDEAGCEVTGPVMELANK